MAEDEMVGWHHGLNGHESEQAPGTGGGQGGLVCCSPRGRKESDTTEKLNGEDEMAGWHHRCNEHELGQILGDGAGQGSLVCCSPRGRKESNVTG